MNKTIISIILTLSLFGCSNKFATNYKTIATTSSTLYENTGERVEIIESNNINSDIQRLLEQSYMIIGTTNFVANSGSQSLASLKKHGESVGAHKIIVNRKHLGSSTISMPLSTPTTSVSSTNSNYNISNNHGGNANIYGNSRTTTYGTQTQYVPITISNTEYSAYYLAKFKSKTGIYPFELTDQDKQLIGQNTGFKVGVIIKDSPAYYANILTNDIVTEINGSPIAGVSGFIAKVDTLPSSKVNLKIFRNGKYQFKDLPVK